MESIGGFRPCAMLNFLYEAVEIAFVPSPENPCGVRLVVTLWHATKLRLLSAIAMKRALVFPKKSHVA
jgi:hypothetical protein